MSEEGGHAAAVGGGEAPTNHADARRGCAGPSPTLPRLQGHIIFKPCANGAAVHTNGFTKKAGNLRRGKVENRQAFVLEQPRLSLLNR
jgi:hypothetical protein